MSLVRVQSEEPNSRARLRKLKRAFLFYTVQVTPGADAVSFMWSYPNMLPLPAVTVGNIIRQLSCVKFSKLYGAFAGKEIAKNADEIVRRSGEKYIACLR